MTNSTLAVMPSGLDLLSTERMLVSSSEMVAVSCLSMPERSSQVMTRRTGKRVLLGGVAAWRTSEGPDARDGRGVSAPGASGVVAGPGEPDDCAGELAAESAG